MEIENQIKLYNDTQNINIAFDIIHHCRRNEWYNLGIYMGRFFLYKYTSLQEKLTIKDINFLEEYAICCNYTNNYMESNRVYNIILDIPYLNHEHIEHINLNNHYNWESIKDGYSYYNIGKIQCLMNKKNNFSNKKPIVSFSVTCCKRLDLFIRTINSFINCCKDIDLIDYWLCVDDNSSDKDREKMKILYPFFDFYFKTPEEKGHPSSMNIIKNKIISPYLFHIEDDWEFYTENDYITKCLEILHYKDNIKQCLINLNYAETPVDIRIKGGYLNHTDNGDAFYIHEHVPPEKHQLFVDKYGNIPNCAYWTHYSFRPSLIKTEIFQLGDYIISPFFEHDYSHKYHSKGWESAFLPSIYCKHIGRLTSERHISDKENAYDLNNEKQFDNKEKNISENINEKAIYLFNNSVYQGINDFNSVVKTYILNLDHRKDRWENVKKLNFGYICYERYSAVNGEKISPNIHLSKIFDGNDYNMRSGIIGCAMSHIKMYIELINSDYKYFMILEDDIELTKNFDSKILSLFQTINNKEFIYLGHHIKNEFITDKTYDEEIYPSYVKWSSNDSLHKSLGGTTGYIISKEGAYKMLEFIDKRGMTNAIDTMQQKAIDSLELFYCEPLLIFSECFRGNNCPDSDIQYNYNSLTMDLDTRLKKELKYFNNEIILIVYHLSQIPENLNNVILVYDDRKSNNMKEFIELYPTFYILDNKIAIYLHDNYKNNNTFIYRLCSYNKNVKIYDISSALSYN